MTTITFEKDIKIKSNFVDLSDLYSYMIENQLLTEQNYKDVWYYKNLDFSLSKVWEKDDITYSLSDIKNV